MENIIKNIAYATLGLFSTRIQRGRSWLNNFKQHKEKKGKRLVNEFLSKTSNQEITSLDFFARYEITDSKYLLPNS